MPHDPILIAQPGTPEWNESRRDLIGASEAAAACGMSEWQSPFELYLIKRGEALPFEGNRRTRRGSHNEPFILEEFCREFGVSVEQYPMGLYRHPMLSFMGATPDAQLSKTEGLEIKDIGWRMRQRFGDPDTDEIPTEYVLQAQQQMFVMGWVTVHFAVMCEDELLRYRVDRNEQLIGGMIDAEEDFWIRVTAGIPPDANWTPALVRQVYRDVSAGTRIELSAEAAEQWEQYEYMRSVVKDLEERAELAKAQVLAEIGNNYAGVLPGGERMIRRKKVQRAGYTVEPKEVLDVRCVRYDGGLLQCQSIETSKDSLAIASDQTELSGHSSGDAGSD